MFGFGILDSYVGRSGWRPAAATAVIVGLLIGDAYRRHRNYGGMDVAVWFDVLAIPAVVAMGQRSARQVTRVAALAVPLGIVGLAVVAGPDWIEQILIEGF